MARFLFLLILALLPLRALAVESAPVTSPRATATLLADRAAIAPGEEFRLMLFLRLAPGWHSYWSNPGDAGAPPEVALRLPEGWSAGDLQFPAPERIPFGPLMNFGYKGEVGFPLPVTAPATLRPGETVAIEAEATWLACADVCIPEEGRFTLSLPVEAAASPANLPRFMAAEAAMPRPSPFAARLSPEGVLTVEGEAITPGAVRNATFFPFEQARFLNPPPQRLALREGGLTLALSSAPGAEPSAAEGVLVLTDAGGQRASFTLRAEPGPTIPAGATGLWQALALALLGGLILNLMPCVFPVLAMKAMALARLGGAEAKAVRGDALGYVLGVLAGFTALGAALLALRAGGAAAGWGFQFTHPAFVAAMAWVMLLVGLNLSGVFAIRGPALGGARGAFGTGLLAVVVATPCTAPFMATAIGAALLLPGWGALLVFAAMGLGLALPYGALAAFPALARLFPRPGPWMERLRQVLAFPMYGAAAWLVWVLAQQAGPDGVLVALSGGVLVALAAWAFGTGARPGRLLGVAAAALAIALLPGLEGSPAAAPRPALSGEAWSPDRLAALRAEGRPVFVNLTAAWCITCKVNERIALDTEATRAALVARNVAVLVGDWTRGDPAITALLRAHGRDGVPLYLLYPAAGGAPTILPQLLTEGTMLEALSALRS
ncbi:protein-disulfide reductase DsbD family protein [Sabulicella rubraurantiaca]|uniref:protein-disulfide reductase DsbD family protein n=1 Tax=Sabulicella rubraurantiaca TaxID=2811429 RepID=UPI001A95BBE7|nr:protein-disulfide reductase DsbD domain-containing protein [Sabulicella rubraurantiaca]